MSSIYEALRSKPAGLWSLDNSLNDLTGNGNTATASGTVNNALSLAKGAVYSSIFNNQVVASFPTTVFQKGNESKAFSLEAWVRPVQKTTGYTAQPYRENLILNPSFEVDLSSWGTTGTVARDSTMGAYGSASVKMTATALDNHSTFIYQQPAIPVSEGQTYTFSVWAKRITGTSNLRLILEKSLGVTFSGSDKTFTLTTSWARYSSTVTIPVGSGITSIIPFVSMDASTGAVGDVINADLVMLEQSSSLGAYLDGSMAGYEWEGIQHNSKSRTRLDVSLVSPVTNPSFEVDSNSDGLADNWTAYSLGTFGTRTYSLTSSGATTRGNAQRIQASGLASGSGNRVGIVQGMQFSGVAGDTFTASADFTFGSIPAGAVVKFYVDFSAGSVWQESASYTLIAAGRRSFTYTLTKNITWASVYVWIEGDSLAATSAVDLTVDSIAVFRNNGRTAYLDGYSDGAVWTGTSESSMTLLLTSSSEQQILGNTGQYDGLVIDGTSVSFVTKYTSTGEARAVYDLENVRACHLVGVHTSDKNLLYVDGVLAAETTISDVQQADTFISSDGKLYSGQTLSSKSIMLNCVGIYTYALDAASILSHFNEARGIPSEEEVPAFYSGDRLGLTLDHANVFLDSLWNSATDWNTGIFSNTVVVNDQLTPQFDSGISLAGTWMSVFPLSVASTATIYGVMADWGGYGAVVELSLDGTTWETMVRGGKMTTLTEGLDPTGKQLFIRVSFTGGVADDDSYIDNLRIVGFADGVLSEVAERTATLTGAAPRYDKLPLQLDDTWGATVNSGGTVVISADTSDELAPIRTVEVWVKPTSSTMPTLSAAGTSYFNGSATGSLRVGEWTLWHVVLSADLAGSLTITGPAQIGQITVYPTALTATNIADIYASYTCSGSEIIPVTDADTLTMIEPAGAANIYAYDWSITGAG